MYFSDLLDGMWGFAMEIGGITLFGLVVIAALMLLAAIPPALIRWAVRQLRAKALRPPIEFREARFERTEKTEAA